MDDLDDRIYDLYVIKKVSMNNICKILGMSFAKTRELMVRKNINIRKCRKAVPLRSHIENKVNIDINNCWNWTGKISKNGYAHLMSLGKTYLAHRISYELFKGSIDKGLVIDHLCRNRKCINPDHLEAVSMRENIIRGESSASMNFKKTHCIRGHEFSKENTYYRKDRTGSRTCKKCSLIRNNNFIERKNVNSHTSI